MRIRSVLIVLWLVIGVVAAGERGYYHAPLGNCSKIGTIALTVVAGPLNYVGVSPKLNCTVPRPAE